MNCPMVVMLLSSIGFWYAVFTIGFFHTLFYVTLGAVVGGLYTRYKENQV